MKEPMIEIRKVTPMSVGTVVEFLIYDADTKELHSQEVLTFGSISREELLEELFAYAKSKLNQPPIEIPDVSDLIGKKLIRKVITDA